MKRTYLIFVLIFAFLGGLRTTTAKDERGWILFHKMLQKMKDLTVQDRVDVIFALDDTLDNFISVDYAWKSYEVDGIRSLISTGFSFGYSPEKIASACKTLFLAYQKGLVHPEELNFLELILAKKISPQHLVMLTEISTQTKSFSEKIRIPLLSELSKKTFQKEKIVALLNFLTSAQNEGLNLSRALVVGIASLEQIESGAELSSELNQTLLKMIDKKRREDKLIRFQSIAGNFYDRGMSEYFLKRVVEMAVEEEWSRESFIYLLQILAKGKKENLSEQKLFAKIASRIKQLPPDSDEEFQRICDEFYNELKREKERLRKDVPQNTVSQSTQLRESEFAKRLNQIVREYLGTPYVWGGTSKFGFDCSGLIQHVYARLGIFLPRISRQQYKVGKRVSTNNLKPGDLVFFSNNYFGEVDHVGIYLGNGKFCHASCSRGVTISSLDNHYYQVHYVGAKRVLEL